MVTTNAAAMLGLEDEIGTLKPGAVADVSVLADDRGRFKLRRQRGHRGDRRPHAHARSSACAPACATTQSAPILPEVLAA